MRRALLLAALLALLAPAVAAAHGGSVIASGGNDAYRLTIEASDVQGADGARAVDLTAYPIRLTNGAPDLAADLTLSIDGGTPFKAIARGDGLEAIVPVDATGAWRQWTVRARLRGAAGTLAITGAPTDPAGSGGVSGAVLVGSALLAAAALTAVLVRRRRARREVTISAGAT